MVIGHSPGHQAQIMTINPTTTILPTDLNQSATTTLRAALVNTGNELDVVTAAGGDGTTGFDVTTAGGGFGGVEGFETGGAGGGGGGGEGLD